MRRDATEDFVDFVLQAIILALYNESLITDYNSEAAKTESCCMKCICRAETLHETMWILIGSYHQAFV